MKPKFLTGSAFSCTEPYVQWRPPD